MSVVALRKGPGDQFVPIEAIGDAQVPLDLAVFGAHGHLVHDLETC
jgi:hypothetical protein